MRIKTRCCDTRNVTAPADETVPTPSVLGMDGARGNAVPDLSDDRLLGLAFEHAPVGAALVALSGQWLRVNTVLCRLVGYEREELLRLTFRDVTHPDDLRTDLAQIDELLAGRRAWYELDKRYLRRDGTEVWVHLTVALARDDARRPLFLITQVQDITERRRNEAELVRQALHDPLTGLANRTLLMDRLDLALDQARRSGAIVGVLYADLDRFKAVNDRFGHATGDEILRAVAAQLSGHFRPGDTVARVGGDEFVTVCPTLAGPSQASRIAERIEADVASAAVVARTGVSLTVGVATGTAGSDAEALLRDADAAMYQRKRKRCAPPTDPGRHSLGDRASPS